MNILFENKPVMFGVHHIVALILIILFNIFFYYWVKNKEENELIELLHKFGILMLIAEVFKQWFVYNYVFNKEINLWFFPFQICSLVMYFAFILKYLNKKQQNPILVYLVTFSLFADVMALILPLDMMREQIPLFIHSFAYHGLIISIVIMAFLILKKRKNYNFKSALKLFFFTAFIAEVINVVAHYLINDVNREPNMFYITPFFPTKQAILSTIAEKYGIFTELVIYLLGIALASYGIYLLLLKHKPTNNE